MGLETEEESTKGLNFEELKVGEAKQNKAAANAELCRASCEVAALMQLGRMAPRFLQVSVPDAHTKAESKTKY